LYRKSTQQLIAKLRVYVAHINRRLKGNMNGQFKRQVAVAVVSLAVGAIAASVLSNGKAREKLLEGSKKLVANWRKNE
jgi:hypothetical protein